MSLHVSHTLLRAAMLALCALPMHGQTADTGAIAGTVSDPSGALVPHAAVVINSQGTGEKRDLATDAEGNFSVQFLPPGNYDLTVRAARIRTIHPEWCSGSNHRGEQAEDSARAQRRKGTNRG